MHACDMVAGSVRTAKADCAVACARALGAAGLPAVVDNVNRVTVQPARLANSSVTTAGGAACTVIDAEAALFALALPAASVALTV